MESTYKKPTNLMIGCERKRVGKVLSPHVPVDNSVGAKMWV